MTLPNPRHEAFAQARADGQTQRAAAVTAGYSRKSSIGSVLTKNKTIIDRIGAIQRAKEATSLETMIQTLMKYADTASKAGSGAGMAAARGLIAEAAKLRMATMKTAPVLALPAPAPDDWTPRPYTEADWDRICQPAG